ncbi:MAG: DUF4130 domain-containing protein [Methanosarcinales archaeon]|nr:DUF4130 domain-containing protein [Methanosarcinales archaeon]
MKRDVILSLLKRNGDAGISASFIAKVEQIPQAVLENVTTDDARRAYRLARDVLSDIRDAKAFTRLTQKGDMLIARLDSHHRIEELVVHWFHDRFPPYTIAISSKRGMFLLGGRYRTIRHVNPTDSIAAEALSDTEQETEDSRDLWEIYYSSQFIDERANARLFRKNLPKKRLSKLGVERRFNNSTIDDFF